ncbi:MAG: response regulator [Anaerolineae bacterium]|nr:response regulator [Anaerolineae bacterium]MCI0609083.1 response regulator [Anaerolineae bacterium]
MMNENYSDKKPVLIVEDIAANRELFSLQLFQFGLASRHVTNGRDALELVQANPHAFSMILMDLQMPVMDGFTTTQLIRQHEAHTGTHIIIVALTANRAENIQEQCLQAGMDDFVHKPVTLDKLDKLLTKWLKDS